MLVKVLSDTTYLDCSANDCVKNSESRCNRDKVVFNGNFYRKCLSVR